MEFRFGAYPAPGTTLDLSFRRTSQIVQKWELLRRHAHNLRLKPITDGRLVHERPTMIRNNAEPHSKPWQVNMKKKLPELKPAPDNINTFGKESNFNNSDELGPWEAKCEYIGWSTLELVLNCQLELILKYI